MGVMVGDVGIDVIGVVVNKWFLCVVFGLLVKWLGFGDGFY